ncbi:unnamed protein product, partial [Ectocarpus sp. 12 AP-2014]
LPSTPSTPPLITNHSSHRQSSFNPINAIHPCLAKAAVKTTTTTTKPPSLQPRYQPIAFHRWILSAGCFDCCFYPAARAEPAHLRVSAGLSAGSPEQVLADRELQYLCPRTGCNTNLKISAKTGPTTPPDGT